MYPFWCGCVPLPLSSAASWLLSSLLLCGRCRCVCFVLASPPFCDLPSPHDGRVLFVVVVSSGLPVAWILRLPLYIIALSFHLHYIGLISSLNSFAVGQIPVTVPSSPFYPFMSFCGVGLFDSCGFFVGCLGRALLALFCFCDFSGRGGRSPVEPWTRLHCSEHYWRCPVVLPAVQSGAP